MTSFTLKGNGDFVKVELLNVWGFPKETCPWGGYDTEGSVEIKSGNFQVKSNFYTSTGELYQFYNWLKTANENLQGEVIYKNYEENFFIRIKYDNQGRAIISGDFSEENEFCNELKYEFHSDQSYLKNTILELEKIVDKYGGMTGKN